MNSQESLYSLPGSRSRRVQKLQAKRVARLEQVTDISKNVLGYVRVSTEEQASKGHSLDAQERTCHPGTVHHIHRGPAEQADRDRYEDRIVTTIAETDIEIT
jgi:hypothetical protein